MAEKLDNGELVNFKELLMTNNYQADALVQLLIDKGIITEQEFYLKLKQVQLQYNKNEPAS